MFGLSYPNHFYSFKSEPHLYLGLIVIFEEDFIFLTVQLKKE